eukprot:c16347_g1_i1 orf=57-1415(+)
MSSLSQQLNPTVASLPSSSSSSSSQEASLKPWKSVAQGHGYLLPHCKLPWPRPSRISSYASHQKAQLWQSLWPSSLRSPLSVFMPSYSRSSSAVWLNKKAQRLKVSAAFSTFGSPSGVPTVNTAYRRVADCLVFPPLPGRKPRALIHFIGGAFIGAVPEVTYSLFIELLRRQDFLIIATPYNVTFEHVLAAELVHQKFQKGKKALVNGELIVPGVNTDDITRLPVFSIGHSNGALLQLLVGCRFQEDLPKANAVIAFNNKPAADAVPYFEQLGPVTAQLTPIIAASPLSNISRGLTGDSLKNLLDAASPVFPQYDKESLQSLQNFIEQIPLVLDQVSRGISEFTPAPLENRKTIENDYGVENTLLVKYKVDAIDESDIIEDILKPAVQKRDGSLTKITIDGNHITPCVQDIRWEIGKVYTPLDAVGQLFRNVALSEIRETVVSVSSWLETFL